MAPLSEGSQHTDSCVDVGDGFGDGVGHVAGHNRVAERHEALAMLAADQFRLLPAELLGFGGDRRRQAMQVGGRGHGLARGGHVILLGEQGAGQTGQHGARAGGAQSVRAQVPLASMFGYATDLRSRTQGRGMFTMQFDHYEEVPKSVAEKIIGAREKNN